MDLVKKIRICEVGPRDGLQNETTILTTEQKVQVIGISNSSLLYVLRNENNMNKSNGG